MARYRDYTFDQGDYGKAQEVIDASAIVLAIKNIILSRPGNFPLTPSLGLDIEKYEFETADDKTLQIIKADLNQQISKYIPSIENVYIDLRLVDDTNEGVYKGRKVLGISVKAISNNQTVETNFLLYNEYDGLHIYNEVK